MRDGFSHELIVVQKKSFFYIREKIKEKSQRKYSIVFLWNFKHFTFREGKDHSYIELYQHKVWGSFHHCFLTGM